MGASTGTGNRICIFRIWAMFFFFFFPSICHILDVYWLCDSVLLLLQLEIIQALLWGCHWPLPRKEDRCRLQIPFALPFCREGAKQRQLWLATLATNEIQHGTEHYNFVLATEYQRNYVLATCRGPREG
ncbi:hypothetical protein SORBI_3004G337975 [Sorghum bicolor]|uniref:Uncharacterized protein n=1 Tax=Sorghum bicolor TaxID=4558 RepID=A0A1Z5RQQ3_SORBI|nr:hypothetical protein SORBI_3004G337975 [Sorghum bicolor]